MMECITSSRACLKCRGCCGVVKKDLYFSALFTKAEVDGLKNTGMNLPVFSKYKGSERVLQVQNVRSKIGDYYACPFLDENSHYCSIYTSQPLDCRLWPFMFARSRDGKTVNLVCAEKRMCPCLEKISPAEFEGHKRQIMGMIRDEGIIETVKKCPELILNHEPDTFVVAEMPELKKPW
jgi:Fe-S-cluster containining protein